MELALDASIRPSSRDARASIFAITTNSVPVESAATIAIADQRAASIGWRERSTEPITVP